MGKVAGSYSIPDEFRPRLSSIVQAMSMAQVAEIDLSNDNVRFYSWMREQDTSSMDPDDDPKTLCDQRLLARVLEISGEDEDLESFKKAYPNIFEE